MCRDVPPRPATAFTVDPRGAEDLEALIREAGGLRRLAVEWVGESASGDVLQEALIAGV